ncbi:response regulator, partial [Desulfobacterales bacterium HSG17]|nr:response regulator [Desulfobacterales bacterium HSG17]
VSELLALKAHEKGIEFTCLVHFDIRPHLIGDPGRLRQILVNLAGNSLKFTDKGEVSILTHLISETDDKTTIKFSIRDTGIGIPKEGQARLFKTFSQVDTSTTRKYGGTGLGLAISKQLAGLMGGQIGVESEEGKGSTFWFTAVFGKQASEKPEDTAVSEIKGKRILVIDPNPTNRDVLKNYLKLWQVVFEVADDAQSGFALLVSAHQSKHPFEMVIMNHMPPMLDAEELGIKIKADKNLAETVLIMITYRGMRGDAVRVQEIGFTAYLTKPVKQSQLFDCLCRAFGTKLSNHRTKAKTSLITKHSLSEESRRKLRILLAEDNLVNQKLATKLLQKFGFNADVVDSGKKAVEALSQKEYDVVLMDVQMPEMDGMAATRVIRDPVSDVMDHNIHIIAMTAHAMKGDRERCIEAGMNDYISKPIKPQELLQKLDEQV